MTNPEDLRDRIPLSPNRVGSVFLGDIQRHRHLSSRSIHSTPTSSPPNTAVSPVFSFQPQPNYVYGHSPSSPRRSSTLNNDIDIDMDSPSAAVVAPVTKTNESETWLLEARSKPGKIDPMLALELRLRWLEALILGVKQDLAKDKKGKTREAEYASVSAGRVIASANLKRGETLASLAQTVQQKLDKALEGNEGLKRFMEHYDQHAHLLTPSFVLSGILPDPPTYDKMTTEEINAFLNEMEPDIRAADRDLLEIAALEKKDVLGAGKLPDYERLQPRLQTLLTAYEEDAKLAAALEVRIASLVQRHATYIDNLSELFVAWDDTVTETEDKLSRMERDKVERLRLGLP